MFLTGREKRLNVLSNHLRPVELPLSLRPTCGIIAYLGHQQAFPILMAGLHILESRGYDSAGISTLSPDGSLTTSKFASSTADSADALSLLARRGTAHSEATAGLGHTRWATHGGRTDANAHPHLDALDRVSVVHNGIIDNAEALRRELASSGDARFAHMRSQTDSEVVAQLLGRELSSGRGMDEALPRVLARLEGTWGLVCLDRLDPAHLYCASHGSPLLVGFGAGEAFCASEPAAFSRFTQDFVPLRDGEWCRLSRDGDGGRWHKARWHRVGEVVEPASPAPFAHWTLREICEQPEALRRAVKRGSRVRNARAVLGGMTQQRHVLFSAARAGDRTPDLRLLACGSSLHAASWAEGVFRLLRTAPGVRAVDASEFAEEHLAELASRGRALVCCVSQSGETKDVARALRAARKLGVPAFAVVNAVGSLIAREAHCGVYCHAGRERAVAATKSFTTQCAVLALCALWFAQEADPSAAPPSEPSSSSLCSTTTPPPLTSPSPASLASPARSEAGGPGAQTRAAVVEALLGLAGAAEEALEEPRRELVRRVAAEVRESDMSSMFVIGRGLAHPIALEGALKIKEISYLHAEGLAAGSLKHGPLALTQEGTPVVAIVLDDEFLTRMLTASEEVKARGGRVYAITDAPEKLPEGLFRAVMVVPNSGPLTSLNAVYPLQLLAYYLSLSYGRNPDRPRNLAKSVTTD